MDNQSFRSKLYAIYDSKADCFSASPFTFANRGSAVRGFQTAVNDPNTDFYRYPADFTLFEIGEYDQWTGYVSMYDAKIPLGTALEYLIKGGSGKDFVQSADGSNLGAGVPVKPVE